MPALLKGFLEQALRPDFAFAHAKEGRGWSPRLGGRSARIVVTMGMPALAYRWWFGAHSRRAWSGTSWASSASGPSGTR